LTEVVGVNFQFIIVLAAIISVLLNDETCLEILS